MTRELKPCPFCGEKAEVYKADAPFYPRLHKEGWYVECLGMNCPADLGINSENCEGSFGMFGTKAEAVEAWNTRAERTCKNEATGSDFKCSECGCKVVGSDYWTEANICNGDWNYCPNCDAKVVE